MNKYKTLHIWMLIPMIIMQLGIFKDYWGNPDKKFVDKSELILIYNSSIIHGDKYVFKFNNQSKILESKFYDD